MKNLTTYYSTNKQGYLPLFLSDCLDLLDPVLAFGRFMEGIDLQKYLRNIPEYTTGRLRYNPVIFAVRKSFDRLIRSCVQNLTGGARKRPPQVFRRDLKVRRGLKPPP